MIAAAIIISIAMLILAICLLVHISNKGKCKHDDYELLESFERRDTNGKMTGNTWVYACKRCKKEKVIDFKL